MFEQLMTLPLFRGVSQARLAEVVGQAKFHFLKYPAGETVVRAGDPCTHLALVLNGSVRLTATNTNGRFVIGQTLTAPAAISPDFLFGRRTCYPSTVVALESTSILKISKADLLKILNSDEVFMFNYLNSLSVNAQKALDGILSLTSGSLDQRIAFWIIALTQPGSTEIKLTAKARDLCTLFGVQRNSFDSTALAMQTAGLIEYNPRQIAIHDRREILQLLEGSSETTDE